MKMIVLGGGFGSDAGYWTIEDGKLVHHGGWEAGALSEVARELTILGQAAQLKTPGLANAVTREVGANVEKALQAHLGSQLGGGSVVIVNTIGA